MKQKPRMITDDFHEIYDAYQKSSYNYAVDNWLVVIGFIVGFIALTVAIN